MEGAPGEEQSVLLWLVPRLKEIELKEMGLVQEGDAG